MQRHEMIDAMRGLGLSANPLLRQSKSRHFHFVGIEYEQLSSTKLDPLVTDARSATSCRSVVR